MKTLFFSKTGPMLQYDSHGYLLIKDLNPEMEVRWHLSRWEMMKLGWNCLLAGLSG
jgi:hypothetical protein